MNHNQGLLGIPNDSGFSRNALEVDIFVTDVVMPGMDGPTWVQKAMKQRPDVNVIFVSGYAVKRGAILDHRNAA
jgi:DNA-binding NtrC family response regulator